MAASANEAKAVNTSDTSARKRSKASTPKGSEATLPVRALALLAEDIRLMQEAYPNRVQFGNHPQGGVVMFLQGFQVINGEIKDTNA